MQMYVIKDPDLVALTVRSLGISGAGSLLMHLEGVGKSLRWDVDWSSAFAVQESSLLEIVVRFRVCLRLGNVNRCEFGDVNECDRGQWT